MKLPSFSTFGKSVAHAAGGHPALFAATALAAPAFLRDDNRGYFRTALVTTPMIGALFATAPSWDGITKTQEEMLHVLNAWQGIIDNTEVPKVSGTRQERAARFAAGGNWDWKLPKFTGRDFLKPLLDLGYFPELNYTHASEFNVQHWTDPKATAKHMEEAWSIFGKMEEAEKNFLATNAIEGARLKTLTPSQLMAEKAKNVASHEPMEFAALRSIMEQNAGNAEFAEIVARRLRQANRLQVHERLKDAPMDMFQAKPVAFEEAMARLAGDATTKGQRPELAAALNRYRNIEGGRELLESATAYSAALVEGQPETIIGLQFTRNGKTLQVPVLDPNTRTVRIGATWNQTAVGRGVYDAQNLWDIDMYLASHLMDTRVPLNKKTKEPRHIFDVLAEDLRRTAYHSVDPTDSWKTMAHYDSQGADLRPHALRMRAYGATPSGLRVHTGGVGYDELEFQGKAAQISRAVETGLAYNGNLNDLRLMTKVGGEGAYTKGVIEDARAELLHLGGIHDPSKQTPFFRDFSKELQLADITDEMRPLVSTSGIKSIGMNGAPEIATTLAGMTPEQKIALMDDAQRAKLIEELGGGEALERAAYKLGSLSEGGFYLHHSFGERNMTAMQNLFVENVWVKPGAKIGQDTLVGMAGMDPVTISSPSGIVRKVEKVQNGWNVLVEQKYAFETGTKVNVSGVKGLAMVAGDEEEWQAARKLLSKLNGGQEVLSDVTGIAAAHYMQAKVGDPFQLLMEQAAQVAARTRTGTVSRLTDFYLKGLQETYNFDVSNGHFIEKAFKEADSIGRMTREERRLRIEKLTDFTYEYFTTMGQAIDMRINGTEGEFFDAFRRSSYFHPDNKDGALLNWMHDNHLTAGLRAWDSARRNMPREITVTYDMFSEMYRYGHHEGIRDILRHVTHPMGNPKQASEFLMHTLSGDLDIALGKAHNIEQLSADLKLRVGTVFDPGNPEFAGNYSIDLGREVNVEIGGRKRKVRYVPVLGHEAYKGMPNQYGADDFSATAIERATADLIASGKNEMLQAEALKRYFDTAVGEMFGKGGVMRARMVDPGGIAGKLMSRPSANPFEVVISGQMLDKLKHVNPDAYAQIAGEQGFAFAKAARHPVSTTPYMQVTVKGEWKTNKAGYRYFVDHSGLGTNMLGFDERVRALFAADDDGDVINLMFMRSKTAKIEASKAILDQHSSQWIDLKQMELLFGNAEDTRNISQFSMADKRLLRYELDQGNRVLKGLVGDMLGNNRAMSGVLEARLVGETIPQFSNRLTGLMFQLESHPTLHGNAKAMATLKEMFWQIRQVPITATKQKQLNGDPWALVQALEASTRPNADPQLFTETLTQILDPGKKGKPRMAILTPEHLKSWNEGGLGLGHLQARIDAGELAFGQKFNVLGEVMKTDQVKGWLAEFLSNRQEVVDSRAMANNLADMVTRNQIDPDEAVRMLRNMHHAGAVYQGAAGLNTGANMSADALGAIIGSIKRFAGNVAQKMGPAMPAIAAGGLLAAGVGLLTTSLGDGEAIEPEAPPSSNRKRPEEEAGASDHVPGAPVTGSGSATNPGRNAVPASTGTRTAVVSPMRRTWSVDVKGSAEDRNSLREVEKSIERMTSRGNNNVNIVRNYSGGVRDSIKSLRTREKIREELDR